MDCRWSKSRPHVQSSTFLILLSVVGPDVQQWLNCEVKIFSFESDDDEDAKMVEVAAEGKVPRDATDDPTTGEMS